MPFSSPPLIALEPRGWRFTRRPNLPSPIPPTTYARSTPSSVLPLTRNSHAKANSIPEQPESRKVTSLNAIKHGCRSQQMLLPHEDPNDWLKLRKTYVTEFDPQTEWMEELLDETVRAHWFYQRNQHNLHATLYDLPPDPRMWTADDHHQIALFTRYQTTAERTYHRALARLTSYHKAQLAAEVRQQKAEAPKPEPKLPNTTTPTEKPKPAAEPVVIEQWVEVRRIDNLVVTQFSPSNEELEDLIQSKKPVPELVYRRIFFPDGVPSGYQWIQPTKSQVQHGGMCVKRMTVEKWLSLREIERETGHAAPTGEPTLPHWRDK